MALLDPLELGVAACPGCNRIADKCHCPRCGSYVVYSLSSVKSQRVNSVTGQTEEFTPYRCRKCALYFDDWQWRNECKAPAYISPVARRQAEAMKRLRFAAEGATGETPSGYTPEERSSKLADLFKGMKSK